MKKKLSKIAGVTLIEILIGIVISVVMMAAMFTSYNVVNNSYSQVTDRAKISSQGRDVIGMMMRDIRNAGYKYYGDNVKTNNQHAPIIITKSSNFNNDCDKIDIVYGDVDMFIKDIKLHIIAKNQNYLIKMPNLYLVVNSPQ